MERSVRDLFRRGNLGNVPVIDENATVGDAVLAFKYFDSGAALVMRGRKLLGLYSERNFLNSLLEHDITLNLESRVSDSMTRKVVYVTPSYRLGECLAVMVSMNIGFLPVIENGTPIALLSMKHIMEALIEDQEFTIVQLVKYVTGSLTQDPNLAHMGMISTHSTP